MVGKGFLPTIVASRVYRLATASQTIAQLERYHGTIPGPGIPGIVGYWTEEARQRRREYGRALRLYERYLRRQAGR